MDKIKELISKKPFTIACENKCIDKLLLSIEPDRRNTLKCFMSAISAISNHYAIQEIRIYISPPYSEKNTDTLNIDFIFSGNDNNIDNFLYDISDVKIEIDKDNNLHFVNMGLNYR